MTKSNVDKVSMLVDNELAEWEMSSVLQSLRDDPEMRECWRNYHLIGDAMRGTLPDHICPDLTDRISQALKHEPIHFNPQASPLHSHPGTHTRAKATIGFALAASMTAIAVFGVVGFEQDAGMQGNAAPAMAAVDNDINSQAAGPMLSSLLNELAIADAAAGDGMQRARIQTVSGSAARPVANDLSEYLMNYHQYATPDQNDDPLSYLRVVSHGPTR